MQYCIQFSCVFVLHKILLFYRFSTFSVSFFLLYTQKIKLSLCRFSKLSINVMDAVMSAVVGPTLIFYVLGTSLFVTLGDFTSIVLSSIVLLFSLCLSVSLLSFSEVPYHNQLTTKQKLFLIFTQNLVAIKTNMG